MLAASVSWTLLSLLSIVRDFLFVSKIDHIIVWKKMGLTLHLQLKSIQENITWLLWG